jgi:hypothetical protein
MSTFSFSNVQYTGGSVTGVCNVTNTTGISCFLRVTTSGSTSKAETSVSGSQSLSITFSIPTPIASSIGVACSLVKPDGTVLDSGVYTLTVSGGGTSQPTTEMGAIVSLGGSAGAITKVGLIIPSIHIGQVLTSVTLALSKLGSPSGSGILSVYSSTGQKKAQSPTYYGWGALPNQPSAALITFALNDYLVAPGDIIAIEGGSFSNGNEVNICGNSYSTATAVYYAGSFISRSEKAYYSFTVAAPPTVQLPTAPTLTVTSYDVLHKRLEWDFPTNADSVTLERAINNDSYSMFYTFTSPNLTDLDITLGSGNTYKYRMYATNSAGDSAYSNIITINTATTTTPPTTTLTAPTLSIQWLTATTHNLIWNDITGATSYTPEQQYNSGQWLTLGDQTGTGRTVSLALGDGTYNFRVRAKNSNGYSAYSNIVTATLTTVTPDPTIQNHAMHIMANGTEVRLISATNYANVAMGVSFPFPARAFCEQTLLMSLPNIPTTLTAVYIGITSLPTNDQVSAETIAAKYGSPNVPPPSTGGTPQTGKLWGIVVGSSLLAFLFGGIPSKHKYNRRTLKKYA